MSQATNNPTLFVFAYDRRLSNDVNADRLVDYVGCIYRFYPGVKIDIVAHSMGGLVVALHSEDRARSFCAACDYYRHPVGQVPLSLECDRSRRSR